MYTRIIQHSITVNYKMILTRQHEWCSDYPWFIKRIEGHKILDLGFMAHTFFTKILCEYGFDVTGVDFNEPDLSEWQFYPGNFTFINSSVQNLPSGENTFSTIVEPSLLEHLGLGFYGDEPQEEAWNPALAEWFRVLKPGGVLLVQVPYGARCRTIEFQGKPYYRIYTGDMIREHFRDYIIEYIDYHSLEPYGWIEVSKSVADHIDHTEPFTPCIAKLVARKQGNN